jgi:hypothetical protein
MSLINEKIGLYKRLLNLKNPTDNEIEIMYYLSKDKDIQNYINDIIDTLEVFNEKKCSRCGKEMELDMYGVLMCTSCEWLE